MHSEMRGIIEAQNIERRTHSDRQTDHRRVDRSTVSVGSDLGRRCMNALPGRRTKGSVEGAVSRARIAGTIAPQSVGMSDPASGANTADGGATLRQMRSDRRRFRRHRLVGGRRIRPLDYPLLASVPITIVFAGLLLAHLGLFELYVRRNGLTVPSTPARELLAPTEEVTGRGGGEPLSIDASVFTQIRRVEYTVQRGDTISEIAYRFGLDPGTILSMNPIEDVRRLLPGTQLSIPDRDGLFHAVQPGESLWSIAESYAVPLAGILDANDIRTETLDVGDALFVPGAEMDSDDYLLAIGELFQWPVGSFRFTSGYGMRTDPITGQWRMHSGVDLANAIGTPVGAARSGRVVHVEPNSGNYGNLVIVDHGDGFRTLYAHLSSFGVASGQWVSTGQAIGRMGNTGRSTGPHLHFSVIRNGRWEDPLKHLP